MQIPPASPSAFRAAYPVLSFALLLVGTTAQSPSAGLRVYSPLPGTDTYLVDNTGAIVHTWPSTFRPGIGLYVLDDGSLLRTVMVGSASNPGGGGGVQRVAFDGTVLWDYRYDAEGFLSHHDIEPMPNGNVLILAWEEKAATVAIAGGRDPALLSGPIFRLDHIVEVMPTGPTTGAVVWEWHVWDHVIQDFDPAAANFGTVAAHPELIDLNYPADRETSDDWNHFNGIDYDPIHDRIIVSAHTQNEIWVIDHSTTTAEAALHSGGRWGRGGDLLYRWGNPAVYRDPAPQTLFGQHAPVFVPQGYPGAGHVMVFNNSFTASSSAVHELLLPMDALGNFLTTPAGTPQSATIVWTFADGILFSTFMSSAERLANGNTLICSSVQRTLMEVDKAGQRVWQYVDPTGPMFHTHLVERAAWSSDREVSAANNGQVTFDLRFGSAHGGQLYHLLASGSGTTPGLPFAGGAVLPLNPDVWFLLSSAFANTPGLLDHTIGFLSPNGSATAGFRMVPQILPLGLELDFAVLSFDTTTGLAARASNPMPVRIGW